MKKKDSKLTCGYCQTEIDKEELRDWPEGKECPVCGTFTFC